MKTIGTLALRFGMWCLRNPDKVDAGLAEIHRVVDDLNRLRLQKKAALLR